MIPRTIAGWDEEEMPSYWNHERREWQVGKKVFKFHLSPAGVEKDIWTTSLTASTDCDCRWLP